MAKIILILSLLAVAIVVLSAPIEGQGNDIQVDTKVTSQGLLKRIKLFDFDRFTTTFGRKYKNVIERAMRQAVYLANTVKIFVHNILYSKKQSDYYLAVTPLADKTEAELHALYPDANDHTFEESGDSKQSPVDEAKTEAVDEITLERELIDVIKKHEPGHELIGEALIDRIESQTSNDRTKRSTEDEKDKDMTMLLTRPVPDELRQVTYEKPARKVSYVLKDENPEFEMPMTMSQGADDQTVAPVSEQDKTWIGSFMANSARWVHDQFASLEAPEPNELNNESNVHESDASEDQRAQRVGIYRKYPPVDGAQKIDLPFILDDDKEKLMEVPIKIVQSKRPREEIESQPIDNDQPIRVPKKTDRKKKSKKEPISPKEPKKEPISAKEPKKKVNPLEETGNDQHGEVDPDNLDDLWKKILDYIKPQGKDEEKDKDDQSMINEPSIEDTKNQIESKRNISMITDWRKSKCFTPIRNQGGCGGCWAFAAVAMLEYEYCRQRETYALLSEQYYIDCGLVFHIDKLGLNGCNGGIMERVFYLINHYGALLQNDHPYVAAQGTCPYGNNPYLLPTTQLGRVRPKIVMHNHWLRPEAYNMIDQLLVKGPVQLSINTSPDFSFYGGGIHSNSGCEPGKRAHAMLIVGSGVENGIHFWLFRNSHSNAWGEQGYYRMSKNIPPKCVNVVLDWTVTFK